MDWFLDAGEPKAISALRHELREYLARHAEDESDIGGAEIAFSELVTNAIQHTPGSAWVHLDWSGPRPVVEVHDLGPGFELRPSLPEDPISPRGRGLFIAHELTDQLVVEAKKAGGSKVKATLPVTRSPERSYDPPRSLTASLPSPAEADEAGNFGKESFLRALVVEMARSVEVAEGPDATQALVAQVGANIGGRMEDEYRRARDIVGDLDPEQIADLYVRLKAAIDGDFYVIEVSEERIVLGNHACPFGEAVKHAPGLCRMTSSVFGGIAARNAEGASVVLEERIAVGDPECRVIVWLQGGPAETESLSHRYRSRTR